MVTAGATGLWNTFGGRLPDSAGLPRSLHDRRTSPTRANMALDHFDRNVPLAPAPPSAELASLPGDRSRCSRVIYGLAAIDSLQHPRRTLAALSIVA